METPFPVKAIHPDAIRGQTGVTLTDVNANLILSHY